MLIGKMCKEGRHICMMFWVSLTQCYTILSDEWTKKLLSNSNWLKTEERKFYLTDLKPEVKSRTRHKSAIRTLRGRIGSYDMITRTHSCKSLNRHDDLDDGLYGAYRTLKIKTDKLYV